jgi:magnesium transporter
VLNTRILQFIDGATVVASNVETALGADQPVWIDLFPSGPPNDHDRDVLERLGLDPLALHDAQFEDDLPKLDDFGDHVLLVLHGLQSDRIETYEVDCFITERALITVHQNESPAVEALWHDVQTHPALAGDGPSGLAARLADGLTRRLSSVVDAFDDRVEDLIFRALVADRQLLADVAAVRADLAAVRRVVSPQREALDLARTSDSVVISDQARRRFSDVFDVASRAVAGLEGARTALAETLEAYRGAEARAATEVTKVLTIYAAVLLPLSLIAGFFGMNHRNLPTIDTEWGWLVIAAGMCLVGAMSLGVFVVEGWVRRPSGRRAGAAIGRGLAEAARAPVQVAGAVYEISTLPLRTARTRLTRDMPAERQRPS